MRGLNERIVSSWNDETSATTQSLGARVDHFVDQRVADVAADAHAACPHERSRCPISAVVVDLPLVPVNATIGALHMRNATSISPNTGTAAILHRDHDRRVERNAGREHGGGESADDRVELLGATKCAPVASIDVDRVVQFVRRLFVGRVDGRAARAQHAHAREAAVAEANDENRLACIKGHHRTRNHPIAESTSEAIQKRAVTLVSGQPPSSK